MMSVDETARPLITFALFSYNQEKFIREAVEGALAQTYTPLEIILSDDCSKDRTGEILAEYVQNYRGPHFLRLNRNAVNLGLAVHVNTVLAMARGKLWVMAAGDDVSAPQRVERIAEAWRDSQWTKLLFCSDVRMIDEVGKEIGERCFSLRRPVALGEHIRDFSGGIVGAAAAFSPRLFEVFGPLPSRVLYDDRATAFRARILGSEIHYISAPLVRYRCHASNVDNIAGETATRDAARVRAKRTLSGHSALLASFILDLNCAKEKGLVSERTYFRLFLSVSFAALKIAALGARDPVVLAGFRVLDLITRSCTAAGARVSRLVRPKGSNPGGRSGPAQP